MTPYKISVIGLLSTGYTASMSIVLLYLANAFLDTASAAEFRFEYNWALTLSLIFALGWDSAIVRTNKVDADHLKRFSAFTLPLVSIILSILNIFIIENNLVSIFSLTCLLVSVLIFHNHSRHENNFIKYILGFNVLDKTLRTIVFFSLVLLFTVHLIDIFTIVYALVFLLSHKFQRKIVLSDFNKFISGLSKYQNIGFLVAGSYMAFMSKGIYLFNPNLADGDLIKLDLILLLASFLFVPIQSIQKFMEMPTHSPDKQEFHSVFSVKELSKLIAIESLVLFVIIVILNFYSVDIIGQGISLQKISELLIITVLLTIFANPIQFLSVNHFYKQIALYVALLFFVVILLNIVGSYYEQLYVLYVGSVFFASLLILANLSYFSLSFIFFRFFRTVFFVFILIGLGNA
jgi:hypothetical protein